jgi:ABC-type molybdate transport system permease subunit
VPDTGLVTSTLSARKGIAACYGILAVFVAPWTLLTLLVTLPPRPARVGDTVVGLLGSGATIGLLVYAIIGITLLFRYRAALVTAASASREHWAGSAAGP